MDPRKLPVYQQKKRILEALRSHQVVVVESPTGSGKTTQIPLILHEAGYTRDGIVGITQPRRIAAVTVSRYIARQLRREIPDLVGYKMRFEDRTDRSTRIKIMTDGILLQEIKGDRDLGDYSVIMVDEAHERSLNIDFILGLLKGVIAHRPEFRVIVSSATINVEAFSEYFDECPIVSIEAPTYPVEVLYEPPTPEGDEGAILDKITEVVDRIMKSGREGDVLIFLSGEFVIKLCMARLAELDTEEKLEILPLYARLSHEDQERVFLPFPGKRKVIIATNIAETSVTIDGVAWVIDPGYAKLNTYNPRTFTQSLVEVPVSKASSNQRRGRAGRTRPGTCYRLFGQRDFESRPLFTMEEILRTDLSEVVLRMAELGIRDFESFDFLSPPGREAILGAVETLRLLDALDEERELTETGQMMVRFPILPHQSRMVVEAIRAYPGVIEEVITAATFLSVNSPFLLPANEEMQARKAHHSFRDPLGDFVSYLNMVAAFESAPNRQNFCQRSYLDLRTMNEILNIRGQLEEIVSGLGVPLGSGGPIEDYLCAVARGLIQFVCTRTGKGMYRSLTAERIQIHPSSMMFRETPQYIVAGEIVRTTRMYARSVSPLKKTQLGRISPLLHDSFVKGAPYKAAAPQKRDFTNRIKIGREAFPILKGKGRKKIVALDWDGLKRLVEAGIPQDLSPFRNLWGVIRHGNWEIMSGLRLSAILQAAPYLDPGQGIWEDWPMKRNFVVAEDGREMCAHIARLLALCPLREKSRNVGFLSLSTDGSGNYWFQSVKGLATAREESLAALESLADEPDEYLDKRQKEGLGAAYHRLADMLEDKD